MSNADDKGYDKNAIGFEIQTSLTGFKRSILR
jgi:hypothetical protein